MDKKRRLDLYTDALRRAGLRMTPQRQTICAYLAGTDRHPTPYQVYADVSGAHPEISRATVYNTLNILQQLGAIAEVSFGADHTHYDTNPEPHINLICLRCHKIVDFAGELALDEVNQRILRETGFQGAAAKVDLVGFCAACREQRRAEIRAQYQGDKP
jgi:Fur family peroxide stress response transcriptional regulator